MGNTASKRIDAIRNYYRKFENVTVVQVVTDRGCFELKIETQNTNVAACKFYERQGCELRNINRAAYPDLPNEVQMLWYKKLS